MDTCCANCSSTAAIGNDIAAVCTDCAHVSLIGAPISMVSVLAIGVLALAAAAFGVWAIRSGARSLPPQPMPTPWLKPAA